MSTRRLAQPQNPFSFVEFALVVAVVGVAAAVAVPEYMHLRQNANDDSARSRLGTAARTLEARHQEAGTFGGAALPAGVRIRAAAGSYCVETSAGSRVWHAARHARPATGACPAGR